jgi:hypothetical protein
MTGLRQRPALLNDPDKERLEDILRVMPRTESTLKESQQVARIPIPQQLDSRWVVPGQSRTDGIVGRMLVQVAHPKITGQFTG